MSDTVLVTCIYHVKYTEPIGGRGNPVEMYYPSLINLFKIGLPLIIYTSQKHLDEIEGFCKRNNFENYEFRIYELDNYRHYTKILENKVKYKRPEQTSFQRCEVLCHSKLYFFEQAFNNKWNAKKVVWIDAGISENSKIPFKHGGRELGGPNIITKYDYTLYPQNELSVFKPDLGIGLSNLIEKKKWFFISLNAPFDCSNSPWKGILTDKLKSYVDNLDGATWVIGTIWGGYKEEFDEMYKLYNTLVDSTIDEQMFPKTEEMYLGVINHIFKKHTIYFDTWYPNIPGELEYLTEMWANNPHLKSFYKIFFDILEHKYN